MTSPSLDAATYHFENVVRCRKITIDRDDPPRPITKDVLSNCFQKFIGEYDQEVPQYSANKLHGIRMSDLARDGYFPQPRVKKVTIHSISIHDFLPGVFPTVTVDIQCRTGTYVRSLCRDVASSLNTHGVVTSLIRTECNGVCIADSQSMYDSLTEYTLIRSEDVKTNKYSLVDGLFLMRHLPLCILHDVDGIFHSKINQSDN